MSDSSRLAKKWTPRCSLMRTEQPEEKQKECFSVLSAISCSFSPCILLKRCCAAQRWSGYAWVRLSACLIPRLARMGVEQEVRE